MAQMAHAGDAEHGEAHASTTFYVIVGVILTIITAIEVAIFYVPALAGVLVPSLLVLSLGKFVGVVAYYMHLRFDNNLFTFLFVAGLSLGLFEVLALMLLAHVNPGMAQPPSPVRMAAPVIALEVMSEEELDAIISALPAEPDQATVSAGADLYPTAVCVGCHGPDGAGVANMGPNLTDQTWLHGDGGYAGIVTTVMQGVAQPIELNNVMPPRGGMASLTDEQVLQLSAYVYSLSR